METRVLNDGYSVRLIGVAAAFRGEDVASYKLILRHPDGTENLLLNAPGTEPNTNSGTSALINQVKLWPPLSGIVKDGVLAIAIRKETWRMDTWWLRWDVKQGRLISMVKFSGHANKGFEFVDANTIKIDGATVSLDGQGRILRNGSRYPKSHDVYQGQRRIHYWPIDQEDGKIEVTENAQVWPFVARPAESNKSPVKSADIAPSQQHLKEAATTPETSQAPVMPDARTLSPTVERKSPLWPWLVGILTLIAMTVIVWKRRA